MKTSVRAAGIKSVGNNRGGLGASELHGKRLDTTSQKRIITAPNSINWSKAGDGKGLDLVEAFKAHKKETGAVERGNAEIGTHLLVVVPPEWIMEGGDIHDPNNPNTLKAIQAAKEWAESWQGEGAVFAYRFDLDEKGTGVIDLFTAPVFEQGRRNGKTVKTISPSMAKREIVKQTGEKTSGAAFQTSWAEWAETNLDTRMERGNRKEETGREHIHAEIYAKAAETIKAEIETEFEVKKVEENDRLERIRAAREKHLKEAYEARRKQLEANYQAKQKQLEQSYEARQAELEKLREFHSNLELKNSELDGKIAEKTNTLTSLDKREADLEKREREVEANEAKKLKLFNKTQVIQDKLEELEDTKDRFVGQYKNKVAELESEYQLKGKRLSNELARKGMELTQEKLAFDRKVKEANELLDQYGSMHALKLETGRMLMEADVKVDRLQREVTQKSDLISSQSVRLNELEKTQKLFVFLQNFLQKHFPETYEKFVRAWNNKAISPENADNEKTNNHTYQSPEM